MSKKAATAGRGLDLKPVNMRWRALLILALWLGFWALSLGLIAILFWLPYSQSEHQGIQLSGFIAIVAGLSLAWSLRPRWQLQRNEEEELKKHILNRREVAGLYQLVEAIGKKLHMEMPVDIYLVNNATAFIHPKRGWFGRIKRLRVGLGLPLLMTLSERELGSVLAHEFGHFIGGDLGLGPWVYRTRTNLGNAIYELEDSLFLFDLLFHAYGRWFLRMSAGISRVQEYQADAVAVQCFGARASARALEKVYLIAPIWQAYLDHEFYPALQRGAKLPLIEGYRRFCQPGVRRPEVQESIDHADERTVSDYDTHPSLLERVRAMGPEVQTGIPPLADCYQFFGGEAELEKIWYRRYAEYEKKNEIVAQSWEQFAAQTLAPQITHRFADSWMSPRQLTLDSLTTLATDTQELWHRLRPDNLSLLSSMGKHRYVMEILEEWIIASLLHNGFKMRINPGQYLEMVRDSIVVQPARLLSMAEQGKIPREILRRYMQ